MTPTAIRFRPLTPPAPGNAVLDDRTRLPWRFFARRIALYGAGLR